MPGAAAVRWKGPKPVERYHANHVNATRPLDALPGERCADAMMYLAFIRQLSSPHYVLNGSRSWHVARDLANAGHLRLEYEGTIYADAGHTTVIYRVVLPRREVKA